MHTELIQGFLDGLRPTARVTVDEWADKYRFLSSVASSEPGPWRTDRTPYLREIMAKLTANDPTERVVVMKGAQVGLALSLDTPIPTVDGWKTMGTIALGDTVFDENGNACRVTLVTPVMYDHQCFEVTFSDGSKIVADADHRWAVTLRDSGQYAIIHTFQLEHGDKISRGGKNPFVFTVSKIKQVPSVPVRCIQVDSPSHLYLAGKSRIPTHNTEAGNNWIGYIVHVSPAPTLMVMPTEAMVKKNSKTRIDPMIEASPILRERIAPARSRDSGNTMLQKEFPGGVLMLVGANSASGLRSMPVRFLFLDEVDAYPMDLDGEGSPLALAMARTRTFAKRKIFQISTPTISGLSIIESEFAATDQRHFHVPCPHCGVFQDLVWQQVRWEKGKPDTAYYECRECNEPIEERYKPKILPLGEWKAHAPENATHRTVGYHINSLYSPYGWYSWADAVRDYEEASSDANKMKTFVNTVQGLTWKEDGESPQFMSLWDKREHYDFNVPPEEVAFLTAGMDVQGDRLEVEIVGWGTGKRSWSIDYRVFDGDTARADVWKSVTELLNETWTTQDGRNLRLSLLCIDSGFNTSHVYNFCMQHDSSRVLPIKGQEKLTTMASAPRAIVVNRQGTKIGSVKVWGVGVNMIKSELYSWLKMNKSDSGEKPNGYCSFPQYDQYHFKSLTAEKVHVVKDKRGYDKIEWVKEFQRNERLDCRVYARAAAYIFGLDRMSDEQIQAVRGQSNGNEQKSSKGNSSYWGGRSGYWK